MERPGCTHSYRNYVIRVQHREQVRAALAGAGIATALPYVPPLPFQPAFAHLGHRPGDFPITETAADQILALPLGPHLDDAQYDYVVATLARL